MVDGLVDAAEVVVLAAVVELVAAAVFVELAGGVWFKPAFAFESEPPQPEAVAQQHSAMLATAMI